VCNTLHTGGVLLLDEFVEKYAGILNGRDVNELFNRIKELTSRSEAARICDLERRTTYYWEDSREVRLSTKQKVLRTILEKDFDYTVKYMLKRIYNASSDILGLYLGTICEKAMNPEIEPQQFQMLINEFREARIKYSPLVTSTIVASFSDMFENIRKRANELRIDFPPLPMSALNVEEMKNLLPQLMKVVPSSINDDALEEISRKFNFPQEFVKFASDLKTISILAPTRTIPRDAFNMPQRAIIVKPHGENVPILETFTYGDFENLEKIPVLPPSAPSGPMNYIL